MRCERELKAVPGRKAHSPGTESGSSPFASATGGQRRSPPDRGNGRSKQAAVHRSWRARWGSNSAAGKEGACASSVAGELDAGCPCPSRAPARRICRGGGRHRNRAPRAPHLARKRSCKAKGGVQPGPVLSRIPGASPLRKMRGKSRKESLSDSRDLDGSYDQLTGEFLPSWQLLLLRAAALA